MFHWMNKTRMIGVLLLGLLLMPTLSMTIMAQDDTAANEVELVGLIEALDMDSITVNGQRILVAAAEINTPLQLGAAVKVEAQVQADLSIRARQINAITGEDNDDMLPGEIEITGLLSAFDDSTMTIAGLIIDVRGAEIKAGVLVGEVVRVHASLQVNNQLQAREVERYAGHDDDDSSLNDNAADDNANTNDNSNDNFDDDNSSLNDNMAFTQGEFELRGTLTSVGDGFVVVQGQNISTIGAEIKGTLTVGAMVKVHLAVVNGALVAREVEMAVRARQGDDDDGGDDDNANSNDNAVVPANCVVSQPAGWTTYTVQSGDTLSGIAQRGGSSVAELALANCITDARFIVVGATLFVPRPVAPALTNQDGSDDDDDRGSSSNNDDDDRGSSSNNDDDDGGGSSSNDNDDDNGSGSDDNHDNDSSGSGSNDNDDDNGSSSNDNDDDDGGSDDDDDDGDDD
jgi:LysM repeat protein